MKEEGRKKERKEEASKQEIKKGRKKERNGHIINKTDINKFSRTTIFTFREKMNI